MSNVKNEIVLATIVGFIIGLLVASGLVFTPKLIPKNIKLNLTSTQPKSSTPTATPAKIFLEIGKPGDQSLQTDTKTQIVGQTLPHTKVIASGEIDDKIVTSDQNGNFQVQISVGEAVNNISVTVYQENKPVITKDITVFYTKGSL